jgi:rhomboid family GlyGly-CTERM serine protease
MHSAKWLATAKRFVWRAPVTVAIGALAILVAGSPWAAELFQYDRAKILGGEIWRLVTCHVTHWTREHLQWDLMMFLVLGVIAERRSPKRTSLCLAAGAAVVSMTVFAFFPGVQQYRGLSGVDTALFIFVAIELIADARRQQNTTQIFATSLFMTGFVAKTGYEAVAGSTFFVDAGTSGFVPLVWDHVAGAAVGAIASVMRATDFCRRGSSAMPLFASC